MKHSYKYFTCVLFVCMSHCLLYAQPGKDVYQVVKSSNGQSILFAPSTSVGDVVYTDVYFRIGPVYEFDSVSGISLLLTKIINTNIEAALRSNTGSNINYIGFNTGISTGIDPEQISFHFESAPSDVDYVLSLINEKIMHATFDQQSIAAAKSKMASEIQETNAHSISRTDAKIMKTIWGRDYNKLNIYGDGISYIHIKAEDLSAFTKKYLLPFNNTLCMTGSFEQSVMLPKIEEVFKEFKSKEFNPEMIYRVLESKPVVNTIQLLCDSVSKSYGTVTYQNPGMRQDRNGTYCAYVLSEYINDPEGRVQAETKNMGIKNLKAEFLCNNFYGIFRLTAEPAGNKFIDLFDKLNKIMKRLTEKEYFKEGELEIAAHNMEIKQAEIKTGNVRSFMNQVCRYRFYNDENYYIDLSDSIKSVSLGGMRRYVDNYYSDHSGITCLYTSDTAMKNAATDQKYYPLDLSIGDIRFTYDLNKTDIETDSGRENVKMLIQWLKINPDMHVQINGFADQGEFSKSYDTSVIRFIDSTSTFKKAMPDRGRKNYLRVEMMRAVKIAKALYEAGITEDRITGTSMVFSSETKEQAAANRKCTITLEKIKPHISLYEYHFGKKKEVSPDTAR